LRKVLYYILLFKIKFIINIIGCTLVSIRENSIYHINKRLVDFYNMKKNFLKKKGDNEDDIEKRRSTFRRKSNMMEFQEEKDLSRGIYFF